MEFGMKRRVVGLVAALVAIALAVTVVVILLNTTFKPLDAPACKLFTQSDYRHILGTDVDLQSPDDSTGAECDYYPIIKGHQRDTYGLSITLACGATDADVDQRWSNFSTAPGVAKSSVPHAMQNTSDNNSNLMSAALVYDGGVFIEADLRPPATMVSFTTLNQVLQTAIKKDLVSRTAEGSSGGRTLYRNTYRCPKVPKQ